jgi:hypothetical protein
MFLEFLIIFLQFLLLFVFFWLNHSRDRLLYKKILNPLCFLSFFYLFWFLLPQIIAIFPPYQLVGLEYQGAEFRSNMVLSGQVAALLFLFFVGAGYSVFLKSGKGVVNGTQFIQGIRKWEFVLLLLFFFVGVVSIFYLGLQFQSSGEMRSELVKSFEGKVVTAISFFANFSFSVLSLILLFKKRYFLFLLLFLAFASGILLTGARGRLLWPLLLLCSFSLIYVRRLPLMLLILLGFSLLAFLLLLDPLMISIREGNFERLYDSINLAYFLESLIYRRSFDSFSNLTALVFYDEIEYRIGYFVLGARDVFMNNYYPLAYESGVGFGATYPGALFLSGGYLGLIIGSFVFGAFLGVYGTWFRSISDARFLWIYLFSVPWICAVGGNFAESFDKLIAALLPGFLWLFLRRTGRKV